MRDFLWDSLGVLLLIFGVIVAGVSLIAGVFSLIATFVDREPLYLLLSLAGFILMSIAVTALRTGIDRW